MLRRITPISVFVLCLAAVAYWILQCPAEETPESQTPQYTGETLRAKRDTTSFATQSRSALERGPSSIHEVSSASTIASLDGMITSVSPEYRQIVRDERGEVLFRLLNDAVEFSAAKTTVAPVRKLWCPIYMGVMDNDCATRVTISGNGHFVVLNESADFLGAGEMSAQLDVLDRAGNSLWRKTHGHTYLIPSSTGKYVFANDEDEPAILISENAEHKFELLPPIKHSQFTRLDTDILLVTSDFDESNNWPSEALVLFRLLDEGGPVFKWRREVDGVITGISIVFFEQRELVVLNQTHYPGGETKGKTRKIIALDLDGHLLWEHTLTWNFAFAMSPNGKFMVNGFQLVKTEDGSALSLAPQDLQLKGEHRPHRAWFSHDSLYFALLYRLPEKESIMGADRLYFGNVNSPDLIELDLSDNQVNSDGVGQTYKNILGPAVAWGERSETISIVVEDQLLTILNPVFEPSLIHGEHQE